MLPFYPFFRYIFGKKIEIMKYSKREARELLDKGTYVLKIEHIDEFKAFALIIQQALTLIIICFHYDRLVL
jgi:cobalamin biosynthesis protein CbiG